jgi:tetratricopeptide (TPR) repeat protein
MDKPRINLTKSDNIAFFILAMIDLIGFLFILMYATQSNNWAQFWSVVGVSLLMAGMFLLIGIFLGLLFGIPRALQEKNPEESSDTQSTQDKSAEKSGNKEVINYLPNTNLEQISDWLTKILVGVGLTQIGQISQALKDYASYTQAGLGNFSNSYQFSIGLLFYYSISGFLIGYLFTRLHLPRALRRADQLDFLQKEVEQAKLDDKVYNMVLTQLNDDVSKPDLDQNDLTKAIQDASPSMKAQIFYEAQKDRSNNWNNTPRMQRTIPVFRALIACDSKGVYHRNHGQLGFALKDLGFALKDQGKLEEAMKELDKAIQIRDLRKENGFEKYEFNRAACRIKLDGEFKKHKPEPSKPDAKQQILNDLKAACTGDQMKNLIIGDKDISDWMNLNQVNEKDICK